MATQQAYREYTLYATDRSYKNEWDIEAYAPGWVKVAQAEFAGVYEYDDSGSHLVALKGWNVGVSPEHRRKGLGSAMYRFAEDAFGLPVVPGDVQTTEGTAFLRGRGLEHRKENPDSTAGLIRRLKF